MTEQSNDPYTIKLMRTLWENTYRGTVFNSLGTYTATIRLIFSIPLDRDQVPEDAPKVGPVVFCLVEDTVLKPIQIIDFEEKMTPVILKRVSNQYFQPDHIIFFYPSPVNAEELKGHKEDSVKKS